MQRLHNGWDVLWLAVSSAELALVVPPKCIYPTHFHQHGRVGGAEGHVNNTMFPQLLEIKSQFVSIIVQLLVKCI